MRAWDGGVKLGGLELCGAWSSPPCSCLIVFWKQSCPQLPVDDFMVSPVHAWTFSERYESLYSPDVTVRLSNMQKARLSHASRCHITTSTGPAQQLVTQLLPPR